MWFIEGSRAITCLSIQTYNISPGMIKANKSHRMKEGPEPYLKYQNQNIKETVFFCAKPGAT